MAIIFKDDGGDLLTNYNPINPYVGMKESLRDVSNMAEKIQGRFDLAEEQSLKAARDANTMQVADAIMKGQPVDISSMDPSLVDVNTISNLYMKKTAEDNTAAYRSSSLAEQVRGNKAKETANTIAQADRQAATLLRLSNRKLMLENSALNSPTAFARNQQNEMKEIAGQSAGIAEKAIASGDPEEYLARVEEKASVNGDVAALQAVKDARVTAEKTAARSAKKRRKKIAEVETLISNGEESEAKRKLAPLSKELGVTITPPMDYKNIVKAIPKSKAEKARETSKDFVSAAVPFSGLLDYFFPDKKLVPQNLSKGEVETARVMEEEAKWDKKIKRATTKEKPVLRERKRKALLKLRGNDIIGELKKANDKTVF